jgi:septum formation protein
MRELILASTSPWRRRMLESAGLRVRCESPGVDERAVTEPDPARLAELLARAKARAVAQRFPEAWVIGADQVVTDGVSVWGKPADPADHRRQLRSMRGRSHDLVTGFCVIGPGLFETGVERTRMFVRGDLQDAELDAYVASGEGSGCAGGYAVEGAGVFLFERIEGDWFNVIGLPLLRVLTVLRAHGWRATPEQR